MTKGAKKGKNGASRQGVVKHFKDIEYADDEQTYGIVEKALGERRFSIACLDGKTRKGVVRKSFKRSVRIEAKDVVIVSLRSFDDSNCDIIYKYDEKGIATLRKEGLIPNAISVEEQKEDEEECGIVFDFDELATKVEEVEEVEIDVDDI